MNYFRDSNSNHIGTRISTGPAKNAACLLRPSQTNAPITAYKTAFTRTEYMATSFSFPGDSAKVIMDEGQRTSVNLIRKVLAVCTWWEIALSNSGNKAPALPKKSMNCQNLPVNLMVKPWVRIAVLASTSKK